MESVAIPVPAATPSGSGAGDCKCLIENFFATALKQPDSEHLKVRPDPNDSKLCHFTITNLEHAFPTEGEYYVSYRYTILATSCCLGQGASSVTLLTPSGRLCINTDITCFSPESWAADPNPMRCLQEIKRLMNDPSATHAACVLSEELTISNLSAASQLFNKTNQKYLTIFHPEHLSLQSSASIGAPFSEEMLREEDIRNIEVIKPMGEEALQKEREEILSKLVEASVHIISDYVKEDHKSVESPRFELLAHTNEKHNGLHVVKVGIEFKELKYLKCGNETQPEEFREMTRQLIVNLLDRLMDVGIKLHKRLKFAKVSFENTDSSMRAIFNGTCDGRPVHRETEVEVLNLSNTKTSINGLQNLHRLTSLEELYLDNCPSIIEAGRGVFSILMKKDPLYKLKLLSVVGTSSALSHKWLSEVQMSCPNLRQIYFTRKRGAKALGWHDIIMMQTMRRPQLLPCGHIGDKPSLAKFAHCSFDRTPFHPDQLLAIDPMLSYLCKDTETEKWTVHIVDFNRMPLDAKTYYHSDCGHFFNLATIAKKHPESKDNTDAIIQSMNCMACSQPWANLRVCYPHSAEASHVDGFEHLGDVGAYSIAGLKRKANK